MCLSPTMEQQNHGQNQLPPKRKKLTKQVTWRDNDSELHVAVRAGDLDLVRRLLHPNGEEEDVSKVQGYHCSKNGGDVVVVIDIDDGNSDAWKRQRDLIALQNDLGETSLYAASDYGLLGIVKEFLLYVDFDVATVKTHTGIDPLHIAAKHGYHDIVLELLRFSPSLCTTNDQSNSTPLYSAAYQGHLSVVNTLLEFDKSLIKIARSNGKTALHTTARLGHLEVVKVLLKTDPDITSRKDNKGQTALHMAVKGKSTAAVEELLKVNPSILNVQDKKGNTALHIATRKWRLEIVELLLGYPDIHINCINKLKQTPLDIAEKIPFMEYTEKIQDLLRGAGAKYSKDTQQSQPQEIRELKESVSDIKHDVHTQLVQTANTDRQVHGIAKELRKLHREGINNTINSVTVVAVLIATIAFAAIFSVPGQFNGMGENAGEALIAHKIAFQVFFVVDSVALFISLAVVVLQITIVAWETNAQKQMVFVINKLMWLACICTSIAFMSLTYIVLGHKALWSAIAVTVIGVLSMFGTLATMCYFVIKHQIRGRSQRKIRRSSRSRSFSWSQHSELTESDIGKSEYDKIYAL